MYRFYVENSSVCSDTVSVTGSDYNHIKNVLRIRQGEKVIICDACGTDMECELLAYESNAAVFKINEKRPTDTELPVKITLYQGMPKKDKMELIIQKAVELGAYRIVPVMTKRVIVKLDDEKKERQRVERWQAIAESAAKQSGRGIIPKIEMPVSFDEAIRETKNNDLSLIPYELSDRIERTREIIRNAKDVKTAGIFIGPEGGFEVEEVELARANGVLDVSLGKRILRTETAGLAILTMLMYEWDK